MNSASATDAPRQAREIVDRRKEARPRQEKEKEKEKGDVMTGWKEGKGQAGRKTKARVERKGYAHTSNDCNK